ncbi:hypothetical protein MHYP_G00014650 [Metynnis hypsauchen]
MLKPASLAPTINHHAFPSRNRDRTGNGAQPGSEDCIRSVNRPSRDAVLSLYEQGSSVRLSPNGRLSLRDWDKRQQSNLSNRLRSTTGVTAVKQQGLFQRRIRTQEAEKRRALPLHRSAETHRRLGAFVAQATADTFVKPPHSSFLERPSLSSRLKRGEERQQHAALRSPCLRYWTENISGLIGSASETHAHDPAVTLSALTGHMLRRATCPVDNRLGKDYQGLARNLAPLHMDELHLDELNCMLMTYSSTPPSSKHSNCSVKHFHYTSLTSSHSSANSAGPAEVVSAIHV